MDRDHLSSIAELELESLKRPLQDFVRTIIERRKCLKELMGMNGGNVVAGWRRLGECVAKFGEEGIQRRCRSRQKLSGKDERGTIQCFGWSEVGVLLRRIQGRRDSEAEEAQRARQ